MKKFKFLKFSKTKKLRYMVNYFKQSLYLIFLPGFMSDIEGKKPQTFFKFAKKNKLGFLTLEYTGHGKSSGIFTKGNISIWSNDTKKVIKITPTKQMKYWMYKSIFNVLNFKLLTSESKKPITKIENRGMKGFR